VITDHLEKFVAQTKPDATILVSGLLEDDEKYIIEHAIKYKLNLRKKIQRDKWISLRFEK
jgi:ribosomal protein L11 methylase PrmA